MPYVTVSSGLTLIIPTNGTKNWGTTVFNSTWSKISSHKHTGAGDGNQMITASYSDGSVTSAKLGKNIALTQAATLAPTTANQAVDFNNGNIQVIDLSVAPSDVTLTFANPQKGARYRFQIKQGATPRNILWPTVLWPQGVSPILTAVALAVDLVELYYDGTSFYGSWENNFQ